MTTHRKSRNLDRQPVEDRVRSALQEVANGQAKIEIEVHDHDGIRGGVITAILNAGVVSHEGEALQRKLAAVAKNSIPSDHPLATWSMVLRHLGKDVSTLHWFEA